MIRRIWENVEAFQKRIEPRIGSRLACGPGCEACCQSDLTVFPVEAEPIAEFVKGLSTEGRERLVSRVELGKNCAFLLDGLCAVYPVRPLICRTHGLPLWVDERVDCCPLNFTDGSLGQVEKVDLLDVARLNLMLSAVEMARAKASRQGSERVRLSELASS